MSGKHYVYDLDKLTPEEAHIERLLAQAWNAFIKLPVQHPQDMDEFLSAIHSAQRIVGVRGIRVVETRKENA